MNKAVTKKELDDVLTSAFAEELSNRDVDPFVAIALSVFGAGVCARINNSLFSEDTRMEE